VGIAITIQWAGGNAVPTRDWTATAVPTARISGVAERKRLAPARLQNANNGHL